MITESGYFDNRLTDLAKSTSKRKGFVPERCVYHKKGQCMMPEDPKCQFYDWKKNKCNGGKFLNG